MLYAGAYGEYYGVQGMTWKDPPILDDPDRTRTVGGRKLLLYYDGSHLRLVAWRTPKAVYWVTNTLTLSIPNSRLIAIAGSLRRLKPARPACACLAVAGDLHALAVARELGLDDGVDRRGRSCTSALPRAMIAVIVSSPAPPSTVVSRA